MRRLFLIAILLAIGLTPFACTTAQEAEVQKTIAATTQAVATAHEDITILQATITALQATVKEQRAVLATQPANTTAIQVLDKSEKALTSAQGALGQAQSVIDKAPAVLNALNDAIKAGPNGSPNFSALGAFGAYGTIAGLILSVGWNVFQTVRHNQTMATVNDQGKQLATALPLLDHLKEVTGEGTHVAAVTAATASVNADPTTTVPPVTVPKA